MPESPPPFLDALKDRARALFRTLAFAEGDNPRVHQAVAEGLRDGLFTPLLLGSPEAVRAGLGRAGVEADRVRIIDPADSDLVERCAGIVADARRARGASLDKVDALARDPLVQAATLVREGTVDGAVAGAVRTTADVVRAALTGIGLAESHRTLSSAFYMVFGDDHPMGPSVLTFTDAGVVPTPTADQLAEIASSAATGHTAVVGEEPRVAFVSYSTRGSAEGPSVTLTREALDRFRAIRPEVTADGELQGDAALIPSVARRKAPESPVAGRANVLVFPDLASANLAYKLVQHLGGATALGPILQGLDRPFNDLSRGATPDDIVNVACITALMADPASPRRAGP